MSVIEKLLAYQEEDKKLFAIEKRVKQHMVRNIGGHEHFAVNRDVDKIFVKPRAAKRCAVASKTESPSIRHI